MRYIFSNRFVVMLMLSESKQTVLFKYKKIGHSCEETLIIDNALYHLSITEL